MPTPMETTVHDMKTNFSRYAAALVDGTYSEIIVKNRSTPMLRITPYEPAEPEGLKFGIARQIGLPAVDLDAFDALDAEVAAMFEGRA